MRYPVAEIFLNKPVIKNLLVALAALTIAIIAGFYFQHLNLQVKHTKHFEAVIHEKFNLIEQQLVQLSELKADQLFSAEINQRFCQEGIFLQAYFGDDLIYWSDNSVPVTSFDREVFINQSLLHAQNGYFLIKTLEKENYTFVGLLLVKHSYSIENEYINNKFNPCFKLPAKTNLTFEPNGNDVYDQSGEYLFSLVYSKKSEIDELSVIVLLSLYLIFFLLIINVLYIVYRRISILSNYKKWVFAFFVADVIIIRAAIFYFKIPVVLYESRLFGPSYLAISDFLPSLGDLLVNAVILLQISWYFYKSFRFDFKASLSKTYKYFTSFTLLFHIFIFFHVYQVLFDRIVFDSVISFNLRNVFELTIHSLLGFLVIGCMLLALFLISSRLSKATLELFPRAKDYFLILISATILAFIISLFRQSFQPLNLVFIFFFVLTLFFSFGKKQRGFTFSWIVVYLFGFSLITTYSLQILNTSKEKQERRLLALELAAERDRIAEYRFAAIEKEMLTDDELGILLIESFVNPEAEQIVSDYIKNVYFDRLWTKYDIQITICPHEKELHIWPGDYIIDCRTYFDGYITSLGEPTDCESLFYIFPGTNYLARFEFPGNALDLFDPVSLYIELNSKAITKGLGYPELLLDASQESPRELYNYSYAVFHNGELMRSVGKYPYNITDAELPAEQGNYIYFERNNHSHLLYNASPTTQLVVSLPKPGFLDIVAPFSYLFIFFGFFTLFFSLVTDFPGRSSLTELSFRNRIQYSLLGIVLVAFLVTGTSTLFYIAFLNQNKNRSNLIEKNHSVLIELEHKLADRDELDSEISAHLNELLTKFSLVFFSDINLYDPNGKLLASSRPQIFEEGLISNLMHPEAFRQLAYNQKSIFIHNESIGSYRYLSSYLPFRNDQNKLIGYVNLPYFARQSELRQEISVFLVAFTNIFVVLLALGLFLALLLSDYLLRPLMLLKANLRKVKLSESTHKIEWKGQDEISELINEYNRMTDELVKSAELLARSERESAWREMAKQVAHEIKNPLTPMKLSVQYLQKAWNDKAPDWDNRLKRFTQTLAQQIDSLSDIASAFSDFASMPLAAHEKVNLIAVIRNSADLFKDQENIVIEIETPDQFENNFVLADEKQLLRVFNNLVQNSVQAIGNEPNGLIRISISKETDHWLINIQDNGQGISEEQQGKIFSPYFTTKSSGMGLGLAIVKNIVSGIGGTIRFTSQEGMGTTFYISLPIIGDE